MKFYDGSGRLCWVDVIVALAAIAFYVFAAIFLL